MHTAEIRDSGAGVPKKQRPRRLPALCLLAALVLCAAGLSAFRAPAARAADAPAFWETGTEPAAVVKVGYFSNGDFMHKAEDGSYAGYDIEYYYTLAGYAGWQLSFAEYPSLDSALAGLENGEIDILSGLSLTAERQSRFLVSSRKMCTSHISVQTRADDDRYTAGDPDTMKDLRCGVLRGSNVAALYTDWCSSNGLEPHIVEYDSIAARNTALQNREVDAIAAGSTIEGAQKIAEFPSLDLYFMFNRGQSALKAQLDRAMNILLLQNPTYAEDLFARAFPATRNSAPSFSAQEKSYLRAHGTLRIAVLADDLPFSRAVGKSAGGILPEYYDHLAGMMGLRT